MNTLLEIEALAIELMNQHGLHNWSFAWSHAKRINGSCYHSRKTIKLSAVLSPLRDIKEVRNTILHEIAHALVGKGYGHGWVWRNMALEIGCDGYRCSSDKTNIQAKYEAKCNCGITHKAHRKPKRTHWCKCKGRGFNPLEALNYIQNF